MITNPVGIDFQIQAMQNLFINKLWTDVSAPKKQFNHRVFKNEKNGEVYPALFNDSTNDYKNVIFNDRLSVLSWFDVVDSTNSFNSNQATQTVGVFFAVNLKDIYPNLSHRAVEEAHRDALSILSMRPSNFVITELISNKDAYGDFSVDNLKAFNMQPWHVFRYNCNVGFTFNCK